MAIANAVLDVIENENLQDNASKVGNYLISSLNQMRQVHTLIGDVRGTGLFIGIDLVEDQATKAPATEAAEYIVRRFKEERIIMSREGEFENILKFKPPMVFSIENAKLWLCIFEIILSELETDHNRSLNSLNSLSIDSLASTTSDESYAQC